MTRLRKSAIIGTLLFLAIALTSVSDAQASLRRASRGAHHASHHKVYHFTGKHRYNYVAPPMRYRKKIVPNGPSPRRHMW